MPPISLLESSSQTSDCEITKNECEKVKDNICFTLFVCKALMRYCIP